MQVVLVTDQKIKLSELKTVKIFSSGSKKMGQCTVRVNEDAIKFLRTHVVNQDGSRLPVKEEVREMPPNELLIQFTNLISPKATERDQEKLQVKVLGDLLLDLESRYGRFIRLTVKVFNDSVDKQEIKTLPEHNVTSRLPAFAGLEIENRPPPPPPRQSRGDLFQRQLPPSPQHMSSKRKTGKYGETSAKEMTLTLKPGIAAHFVDEMAFPESWKFSWQDQRSTQFFAEINIIFHFEANCQSKLKGDSVVDLNRKLLQEKVEADVEIIAAKGEIVKCNSLFLIGQSSVLKKLLEVSRASNDECMKNKIFMKGTSVEGVNAFLAYLYWRDLQDAKISSVIAVELFQAASDYLIESLETAIKELLMSMNNESFDVDAALSLVFFVNKKDNHADLKAKAIKVLKKKPEELEKSEEYQKVMANSHTAKELNQMLLRS